VDWDVYRSIIEQIQAKGVVYNTMAQSVKVKKARGKKVSQRAIPRLAIRQPADLEQALSGLQGVLRELGPKATINSVYVQKIIEKLPRKNPYHTNAVELTKTLRLLGLIDDSRQPTSITVGVWGRATASRTSAVPPAKPRLQVSSADGPKGPGAIPTRVTMPSLDRASRPKGKAQGYDVFVGNLDHETTPQELDSLFASYGQVMSVKIPPDYVTGRSRGFAFIRMAEQSAAAKAIEKLSGQPFRGRPLRVSW
jgi:ATP-dependent DNA helicase RecG